MELRIGVIEALGMMGGRMRGIWTCCLFRACPHATVPYSLLRIEFRYRSIWEFCKYRENDDILNERKQFFFVVFLCPDQGLRAGKWIQAENTTIQRWNRDVLNLGPLPDNAADGPLNSKFLPRLLNRQPLFTSDRAT